MCAVTTTLLGSRGKKDGLLLSESLKQPSQPQPAAHRSYKGLSQVGKTMTISYQPLPTCTCLLSEAMEGLCGLTEFSIQTIKVTYIRLPSTAFLKLVLGEILFPKRLIGTP